MSAAALVLTQEAERCPRRGFFREPAQLALLQREVARWVLTGASEVRVWCAAAGTGEVPYSVAMVLHEALQDSPLEFRILGTDCSTRALAFARQGRYPAAQFAEVPALLRARYCEPASVSVSDERVVSNLRLRVAFRRLSLATPPFTLRTGLDVIVCREQLGELNALGRRRLLVELGRLLKPGGLLLLGRAERLEASVGGFESLGCSVYRKVAVV
jgi:chemotaxis protein methyltransferase CheR